MAIDVRVSILNPSASAYLQRDVYGSDFKGGSIAYDDATGAGELRVGLRYDEMFTAGYYSQFNIVEISTGDDSLAQAVTTNLSTNSDSLAGWSVIGTLPLGTGGPGAAADFEYTGTGSPASSNLRYQIVSVTPGTTYSFSMWIDPSHISSGNALLEIAHADLSADYQAVSIPAGASGRQGIPGWVCPGGVTSVALVCHVNAAVTVANGQLLKFSQPMFEQRLTPSPWYAPSGTTTRLYPTSNFYAPYDPGQGEDTQQVYLWDGATLTIGLAVVGIGNDPASGHWYLTCNPPMTMPGNPTTVAAYGVGTILGRRRYAGIIRRVERPNQKAPSATVTLGPLSDSFNEVQFGYTVGAAAAVDVTTAIYGFLSQNASRWPHLTISAANFATPTGSTFIGNRQACSVAQAMSDAMQALSSGDLWIVRVGHDRTPRMIKVYTSATNTYPYTVTLTQGTTAFEPANVVYIDNDCTNYFNAVQILGATDPATQQSVSVIDVDATAVASIGRQIDSPPVTVSALPTVAACSTYGLGLLNTRSLGQQRGTFTVGTRNDGTWDIMPQGLKNGDVVRGVQCVTVAGMSGGAPSIFGLVTSCKTTIDSVTNNRWQDVAFAPVEPDWMAYVAQRDNATLTTVLSNTGTGAGQGAYSVSAAAYPPSFSAASLVLTSPAFYALFAAGSSPVSIAAHALTLPASATTWIWLSSSGTWSTQSTPSTITGSILYGYATTNVTGVVGFTQTAPVALLNIPGSYLMGGVAYTPTLNAAVTSLTLPTSTAAFAQRILIKCEVTNQPTDGSFAKAIFYYRQSTSAVWMQLATSPPRNGTPDANGNGAQLTNGATNAVGDYGAELPDAGVGITYELGIALESMANTETVVVSLGTKLVPALTSSTPLNGQGNIVPSSGVNINPSYTSTSTSLTLSVGSYTFTRSDSTATGQTWTTPATTSLPFNGLSPSTTYHFNIWYVIATNTVVFTKYSTSALTPAQIMDAYQDGLIPIYLDFSATTPASGTGSGGGGGTSHGSEGCPATYQAIETRERGFVRADSLCVGEHLRDPFEGWNAIEKLAIRPTVVYRLTTDEESVDVNDTHAVLDVFGAWRCVTKLAPGALLAPLPGHEPPVVREIAPVGPGEYVVMTCERHRYVLGRHCAHNITL